MPRQIICALGAVALCWPQTLWALPKGPDTQQASFVYLDEKQAQEVSVVPLAQACLHTTLQTVGKVTYDDMRVAHIVSPVTGRVDHVIAQPGDVVAKGSVLATLRSPDFATARADWHKAQTALELAKKDLTRQDGLFKRGAAPEQVVLAAWDVYRRAISERDRARGNLALLGGAGQHGSDAYHLRTPIAGVVVSRSTHPGMEIAGQYGGGSAQELFLVADLTQVWVVAEVPEADVGRIATGADVLIHIDALPEAPIAAKLDFVAEVLDPAVHTAHVRCIVDNASGKLKPDQYATLTIAAKGSQALAVPKQSVVRMADAAFVYVEQQAQGGDTRRLFERRHITTDEGLEGPLVPIVSGLKLGERVVVRGSDLLTRMQESQR